jgi:DNA-binding SARP family transcriptional activator
MGLTQQGLADLARVSVGMIRDLEQSRTRYPHAESAEKLALALGLDMAMVRRLIRAMPTQAAHDVGAAWPAGWRAAVHGLRLSVLGPLEAWRDGTPVGLGEPKQRAVLALLALSPYTLIQREVLIDALWRENPPQTAVQLVQGYVSRLRHILDPGRPPHDPRGLLVSVGACYRLQATEDQLDLLAFGQLAGRARAAASAGELDAACEAFEQALELWRPGPLADVRVLRGHPAVTQLSQAHAATVMEYAGVAASAGSPQRALSYLQELTVAEPLNEKAHALLMDALAGSGRQAMALQEYEDLRRRLDDELGVRPGRELSATLQRVLRQEASAAAADAGTRNDGRAGRAAGVMETPITGQSSVPRQLPPAVRHFVGRRAELESLTALLDQPDGMPGPVLITAIGGTAGVGKTALAVHWAHQIADRFPDGQLYVNLRGFDPSGRPMTPAEAIRGLLDALEVPAERLPASQDAQAGLYRSLLSGRRMLVLLDNARDAGQVRSLLPGSPGCLVVVTSRSQLAGLVVAEGAYPLTLDMLTEAEARELLALRLGAERLSAEPRAAAELIGLCARLPLALAIASARPRFPLRDLAAQLRDTHSRLDALDAGDPAASVRAVFSWSTRQLTGEAARMFGLLGIHPGPDISVPAAASLARRTQPKARALLCELARAHLIAEHVAGRYAFHDLLRAYAAEQAHRTGTEAGRKAAVGRVLDHYLHTAAGAARLLDPSKEPVVLAAPRPGVAAGQPAGYSQALAWFEAEYQVLLAAVAFAAGSGFDAHAWQLPWAMAYVLQARGHWQDWAATQRLALAAATRLGDTAAQALSSRLLAMACNELGDYEQALGHYTSSLTLYQRLGDRLGEVKIYQNLTFLAERQGRDADALGHAEQALRLCQAIGDQASEAVALNALGWCHGRLGDYQKARAFCRQAVTLSAEAGHRRLEGEAWDSVGYAEHHLGNLAEAAACYQRALSLHRESGFRYDEADTLTHLGDTRHAAGELAQAREAWRQALAILEDLQHPDVGQVRAKLASTNDHAAPNPST